MPVFSSNRPGERSAVTAEDSFVFPQDRSNLSCYFCGQNEATRAEIVEVYRVTQHKIGIAGYHATFATFPLEIPCCSDCDQRHRMRDKIFNILFAISYLLGAVIIWRYCRDKDGDLAVIGMGLLAGLFLAWPISWIWFLLAIPIKLLLSTVVEFVPIRSEREHPAFEALVRIGWSKQKPVPKVDPLFHETLTDFQVETYRRQIVAEAYTALQPYASRVVLPPTV
jgi:hypothetical protein